MHCSQHHGCMQTLLKFWQHAGETEDCAATAHPHVITWNAKSSSLGGGEACQSWSEACQSWSEARQSWSEAILLGWQQNRGDLRGKTGPDHGIVCCAGRLRQLTPAQSHSRIAPTGDRVGTCHASRPVSRSVMAELQPWQCFGSTIAAFARNSAHENETSVQLW